MKFLNWFLKIFGIIKDSIDTIKTIIIIVIGVISFLSMRGCIKEKNIKEDFENILKTEIEFFETESGLKASEIQNWKVKYKDLKKAKDELSENNSKYLNELNRAKKTIKDLNIKLKNAKNYVKQDIEVRDTVITEFVFLECDKVELKPIRTKHLSLDFIQEENEIKIPYKYNCELKTIISRYPERKKNGKKHFPNWGTIWGWNYKTTSVCNDQNAKINNLVELTFDK